MVMKGFYARVWRWHFYAGLYVVPFVVMLALTGLVMVNAGSIEGRLYADRLFLPVPGPAVVSLDAQLSAVSKAFPDRTATQIRPGFEPARSTQVLTTQGDAVTAVYVDPTSARILGEVADADRPAVVAQLVHGTLLLGPAGDWLIEVAAGLGIVLIVSGLYLWWPRDGWSRALAINLRPRRLLFRDLHKLVGLLSAPVLLVYLISGLAWTDVWGARFTQAWSTFPAGLAAPPDATSATQHGAATYGDILNHPGRTAAPWGLEQAPIPISILARQHEHHSDRSDHGSVTPRLITADQAVAIAQTRGMGGRYVVRPPAGPKGVWTISRTGMTGVIRDPRQELTVHVDQYSGEVRGVVGWSDYSLPAKGMALGVPLHQGSFGPWNVLASSLVCLAVLSLSAFGTLAWWWRRPSKAGRLVAPPLPVGVTAPRIAIATAVIIGALFPLVGLTFVIVALADAFVVPRIPALRAVLS